LNNIKEKSVRTNLKRDGVECYTQTDEYKTRTKQTRLEKYGNENYNNNIRSKETCLKRYGVEYPQQNLIFFNKQQISGFKMKKYKETNLTYQGTYELDFINEYYNKINIENGPTIRYNDNKVYFPDFYLPEYNLIVEIKSEYYYNQYLSKNLEKQKACLKQGYNFIFIVNKDYTEFNKLF
jgi:predicted nuclease of restriction endonuclease-like RecB superfamily